MDEKEYIERGALIETMFPIGMPNDGAYPINAKAVRVAIEKAPAADVVEVVRCGECVHRNSRSSCAGRHKDWFCADGVRRWKRRW